MSLSAGRRRVAVKDGDGKRCQEDDLDSCPVCLESLIPESLDFHFNKSVRMTCCGKRLCSSCHSSANRLGHLCPLCRQRLPSGDEENQKNERKHAVQGRAWACHNMGVRYAHGVGVKKNHRIAYEWYRRAGDTGYVPSLHAVAQCYRFGTGVSQHFPKAWDWYAKALKSGYALSQNSCAVMYYEGVGAKKNLTEALRLFHLAAEQGYTMAQERLARCYEEGHGVDKSLSKAIHWRLEAAKQNHADSQHNLSANLSKLHTKYLPPPAAVYWLRKAAQTLKESQQTLTKVEFQIDLRCANCGYVDNSTMGLGKNKKKKTLRRCSKCKALSYCSTTCQREHWKKRGHNRLCCDSTTNMADFILNIDDYGTTPSNPYEDNNPFI